MGSLIQSKKRIMMMQRESLLPPEYKQIAYLESDGTQYIHTDVLATSGIECKATIMWLTSSSGDQEIFGGRKPDSDRIMLVHQYPKKKWAIGYGISHYNLEELDYGEKFVVETKAVAGEQFLKINGRTIYSGSDASIYSPLVNMSIFGCSMSSSWTSLLATARIYNLSAKYNGTLVLNVIPCVRKLDNKPGMYDTVTGTFYTNNGTGEFIIPD